MTMALRLRSSRSTRERGEPSLFAEKEQFPANMQSGPEFSDRDFDSVPVPMAVAVWPIAVEVVDGEYMRHLTALLPDGSSEDLFVPLFSRRLHADSETTVPGLYLSDAHLSSCLWKSEQQWKVIKLGAIEAAKDEFSCEEVGITFGDRNPLCKWRDGDMTYFVDSSTLLEHVVSVDEPLFRLLLSPFRDCWVQANWTSDRVVLCFFHPDGFNLRSNAIRQRGSKRILHADLACMAHWMASSRNRLEIERCAESIRQGGPLHVPNNSTAIMASISGYSRGNSFLVRSLAPLGSTPIWPTPWSEVIVIDRCSGRGYVVKIEGQTSRGEGTLRPPRQSASPLTAEYAEQLISGFDVV